MDRFIFTFQDSCENVAVSTFTPSDNGGKQAFTVTGYTLSDYVDVGDDLAFTYSGNYYVYTIIDITGNQITMSFDYNAAITNVNTTLQFSIKVTCNPYNFNKGKFEWNKDTANYFYKMKYSGKVLFKGDDYTYLYNALNEGCCSVLMKTYKYCEGGYSLFYRSKISKSEGTWNESRCTFETDIIPVTKYDCILANSDIDKNIYECEKVSTRYINDDEASGVSVAPYFEYTIQPVAPVGVGTTFSSGDGGADFIEINTPSGEAVDPVTGNAWTVFVREKKVFIYEGDFNFTPPSLAGYTLTNNTQYVNGKVVCEYTKLVPNANAPKVASYTNGGGGVCDNLAGLGLAILYDSINDNCVIVSNGDNIGIPSTEDYNSVFLSDSLALLCSTCNNIQYVTSDFFEINPIGDTIGYVSGDNYVTGKKNYVNHITLSNSSDVLYPSSSSPSLYTSMSFSKLMKNLNYMFNVYWFIDSANRLRIEHDSWFTNNLIVDLSLTANNLYKKEYSYIKDNLPNKERFTFRYAINTDFVGTEIVYDINCTNTPEIFTRASEFVTDIHYLRNLPPENFSTDFIVMFATLELLGPSYWVFYEEGVITGEFLQNNHLSWANLQDNYHRYGRIIEDGNMNFNDVTFDSWRKLRKQNNQKYIGCCLDIPENQGNVITELGTGDATKITYDINTNTFEFELNI